MKQPVHIIKAQEYQIVYDDASAAHRLQTGISGLQDTRIDPLLDQILTKFSADDFTYQFDSIELNLGAISAANYENELLCRIEESLSAYLSAAIDERGKLRVGTSIKTHDKLLENLAYFLQKGHLKWNTNRSLYPSGLLKDLIKAQPVLLDELLKRLGKERIVRQRMIFQFTDTELDEVVRLTAKKEGEYMIAYKDHVLDCQKTNEWVNSPYRSVKSVMWELILAYLFTENRSYSDKKNFLQHLIGNLASKYNLTYLDLLKTLTNAVQNDPQLSGKKVEFGKLIGDLEEANGSVIPSIKTRHEPPNKQQWLQHLGHYLDHGTFDPEFRGISKSNLNRQILVLLRSEDKKVVDTLDEWLINQKKKARLLHIFDAQSLNELVQLSRIPSIKITRNFLAILGRNSASLSDKSRHLIESIITNQGTLILSLPAAKHFSEKKQLHGLLRNLLSRSRHTEDDIIQFLLESKPGFTERHQKIIDTFLMSFYQNMGKVFLEQITSEIIHYTHSNPKEYWQPWMDDKIKDWLRSTGLSSVKLLHYITKNLRKSGAPVSLQLFLDEQNRALKKPEIAGVENEVQKEVEQRQNEVLYLFEHGKLPWWIEGPQFWNNFSTEYARLWSSKSTQKVLLSLIQKHSKRISYVRLLDHPHYVELILELTSKHGADMVLILTKVHHFIERFLFATGNISTPRLLDFKEAILNLALHTKGPDFSNELFQYLKNWNGNVIIARQESLSMALRRSIKEIISEVSDKSLHRLLEQWRELFPEYKSESGEGSKTPGSLVEFLMPFVAHPQKLRQESEVLSTLQQMVLTQTKLFDRLLKNEKMRSLIVSELPKSGLIELVQLKLGTHQKESYQQVLHQLDRYKGYISMKEYARAQQLFSEFVLLQLSTAGMRSWNLNDWARMLFHTMNMVVGKPKHNNILFRIKEKLRMDPVSKYSGNLRFITQLNDLADETSDQVLAETKVLFDAMVETSVEGPANKKPALESQYANLDENIDVNQRSFYRQMLSYLDRYSSHISLQEGKEIKQLIFSILETHLSKRSLRIWRVTQWGGVLYHSANKVLGVEKNKTIIFRVHPEIKLEKAGGISDQQSIPGVLQSLAAEISEQELVLSKKLFQSSLRRLKAQQHLEETRNIKEHRELIEKKLHPNQINYYREAIIHLSGYKTYISSKEYHSIWQLFSNFLYSRIEDEMLRTWGMKNWGHLLYHSINQVIGKQRNKDIRLQIAQKLNIETEIEINESEQLINLLSKFTAELPKGITQESEEVKKDQLYKKLGEEGSREYLNPIYIGNSGLIILAPYLAVLFERCGLMEASRFLDETSRYRAIQLLSYAATGKTSEEEHDLVINKLLCGLNLLAPMDRVRELSEFEKETVDGLLTAITQQWSPLKESSIDALRQTFLQRTGKLMEEESFYLKVEQKSYDMLLDQIPWNISKIKLSWMQKILEVEWRT